MIDTHAHINYPERYGDEGALFADLAAAGIEKLIDVGWNYDSSLYAAQQAERCPFVYFAAGIHPSNLADFQEGDLERIAQLLRRPKGVAVGEIGLDYHYDGTDEEAQKRAFAAQMELAHECRLPFIIHSRDAAADHPFPVETEQAAARIRRRDALFFGESRNGGGIPETGAVHFLCRPRHL